MEIQHPRRILAVSRPDSSLLDLIKDLTGTLPSLPTSTISGTTHTHRITTTYYTATIPIWLDEIVSPSQWSRDFLSPEAKEVLSVLGAFVVCFRKPVDQAAFEEVKGLLESVSEVVREGCGYAWDGVCLAVAMPQAIKPSLEMGMEEWEDVCQGFGFEFVDGEGRGRNEFSEPVGIGRLKEALEANDWDGGDDLGGDVDTELNLEEVEDDEAEGSIGFGIDRAEMESEMFGMKQAIYSGGADVDEDDLDEAEGDKEIEQLQAMMLKMQAVRDMGADLPEAERKRFAAKAVNEIMKTL